MSKLVDKERLARLAKALDNRMKEAVEAEATRAKAAEAQALKDAKAYTDGKITEVNGAATELGERVDALEQFKSDQEQNNADQLAAINGKVAQADYNAKMELLDAEDERIAGLVAAEETRATGVEAGFETRIAANEAFVTAQPAKDEAQDDRIKALEDDAPVKQAAIEAAQAAADDAQDAAEKAQADADALEERMEAAEEDIARLDGAVDVEGSVKKQIADAIAEVNGAAVELEERVEALEDEVDNMKDASIEGSLAKQIADEVAARGAADTQIRTDFAAADNTLKAALQAEIDADVKVVADELAKQKDAEQEGTLAYQIAAKVAQSAYDTKVAELVAEDERIVGLVNAEQSRAEGAEQALSGRIQANENKLAGLEEGCDTVQAAIDKAEADAKTYADEKITALVDSAPEAMNTLNELAKAINDNQDVYDAYVEEHAQAMSTMKKDLQAEIDADVKVEKERAEGVEAAIRQEMADAIGQHAAEGVEASGLRKEIDDAVAAEKTRAEEVEQGLDGRLDSLEALMGIGGEGQNTLEELEADIADNAAAAAAAQDAADQAQEEVDAVELRVDALEAKVGHDAVEGGEAATGLFAEVDEAKAAAKQAQDEVDAVEGRVDVLETFVEGHDHTVMAADIAANKAAIEAEVGKEGVQGNRDAAIAKALEDYSTTEEMKAILGNVVNSLALSMEDNKLMLKLGGVEGITIHETALDMATDADIDAIITGLDAE